MKVRLYDKVAIHLSDAPEITGHVIEIQEDEKFGDSYKILPMGRSAIWVSIYRIDRVIESKEG